ncbi:hypothetical protein [Aquimarina sp. 2201CG5-10]|nr:hypothetical protein [Aquimarina sp. 2201CG5-10]MDY8134925.1 hypothetical protein [Aquimarina sp. 2201CG5-10]
MRTFRNIRKKLRTAAIQKHNLFLDCASNLNNYEGNLYPGNKRYLYAVER